VPTLEEDGTIIFLEVMIRFSLLFEFYFLPDLTTITVETAQVKNDLDGITKNTNQEGDGDNVHVLLEAF
jgi:hypothetical protein